MNEITFIDLFAGIGGFRIALERCGCKCVFSSEIDTHCQNVYNENFGEIPKGDITKISSNDIPDFDILCAGFPCQSWSKAGKMLGFNDIRGTLFFDICRIIKDKKPNIVILENVKNLVIHNKGKSFKIILQHLKELGYNVSYKVLNAVDFGIPQNRERVIIVATKGNYTFNFDTLKNKYATKIEDIIDYSNNDYISKDLYTILKEEDITKQKSGLIFCGYLNKNIWQTGTNHSKLHLSRCHRQPNRIYSIKGTHPTISSQESAGRYYVYFPDEMCVRKLTIDECYKLMGFPKEFIKDKNKSNAYKQCGNSVVVPMIEEVVKNVIKQIYE
jgi:DNA (cytosine-5)-methyltransferase 1